jgi:hypothetical protein
MFGGDKRSSLLIPTVSDEKSFIILTSSGNPNLKGRPSTLDLLLLPSLDQLPLIKHYYVFHEICYFDEEVNCTEPSLFS